MTFTLPLFSSLIVFGTLFDLRFYSFWGLKSLYDEQAIEPFIQVTKINELVAEYMLIETESDFRKFLGIGVAPNLNIQVGKYEYKFKRTLTHSIDPAVNRVYIGLKLTLKTVNKTVPLNAPKIDFGKEHLLEMQKTHYVKSIIYGYEVVLLTSVHARNGQHQAAVKNALLSSIGRTGTLDDLFNVKLRIVLRENRVGSPVMMAYPFGVLPPGASPHNLNEMLALKNTFEDIMKTDDQGGSLYYEMEALSFITPGYPFVEINSEIENLLYDIELKKEDVDIAMDRFDKWERVFQTKGLTSEEEDKLYDFSQDLEYVFDGIGRAIHKMDITNFGSVDQFSEALRRYGNTSDNYKYRKLEESFRQQLEKEHAENIH